jgi:hypothetical protein
MRDKTPPGLSAFSAAFSYSENQFPPLIYFFLFTAHLKGFFLSFQLEKNKFPVLSHLRGRNCYITKGVVFGLLSAKKGEREDF